MSVTTSGRLISLAPPGQVYFIPTVVCSDAISFSSQAYSRDIFLRAPQHRVKKMFDCTLAFHRKGKRIASFRKAFKAAAGEIGVAGLVPHDMRRSAVRNFRRAGLSEHEGMKLSGHETDSIYRRYDIISDDDLTESMNRVQEHLKKETENRKVVPLKRESA